MAFIVLTHTDDGESQVDIYERRPSYVIIDKASVMLNVSVEKSRYKNVSQDIKQLAWQKQTSQSQVSKHLTIRSLSQA
jgi:hypothetical protein